MSSVLSDLRQAGRTLRRQPVFALVAVVSLAVGIGVNTAIFSVLDALLFRPPALRDPDRAVVVYQQRPGNSDRNSSYRAFELSSQRTDIFANVMAVAGARPLVLTHEAQREQVYVEPVSAGFFAMTTIPIVHGGPIPRDADRIAVHERVVVLRNACWMRRFNGDPSIVGKAVTLNGQAFIVTGVAGEGFRGMSAESCRVWPPPCSARSVCSVCSWLPSASTV
jgi:putative ABC transport system permease protein